MKKSNLAKFILVLLLLVAELNLFLQYLIIPISNLKLDLLLSGFLELQVFVSIVIFSIIQITSQIIKSSRTNLNLKFCMFSLLTISGIFALICLESILGSDLTLKTIYFFYILLIISYFLYILYTAKKLLNIFILLKKPK